MVQFHPMKKRTPPRPRLEVLLELKRPTASLTDMAKQTGIPLETLSRFFNRRRKPSFQQAKKISDYLKVSLDDLSDALGL